MKHFEQFHCTFRCKIPNNVSSSYTVSAASGVEVHNKRLPCRVTRWVGVAVGAVLDAPWILTREDLNDLNDLIYFMFVPKINSVQLMLNCTKKVNIDVQSSIVMNLCVLSTIHQTDWPQIGRLRSISVCFGSRSDRCSRFATAVLYWDSNEIIDDVCVFETTDIMHMFFISYENMFMRE